MKFYYLSIKMARTEKLTRPNTNEPSKAKREPSYTACGIQKEYSHFGRLAFSYKVKHTLAINTYQ